MMKRKLDNLIRNRTWRHILFWVCWVIGFTFIKSFGKPYEIYFGNFSYYILTLPIFIAHTYLVAYVLIPCFLSRKYYPVFIVLFMVLFYGFSVLELILSNEFIYVWYTTGSAITDNYLAPGKVIISGLGNLYIVLVFLAARTVRDWYHADNKQKELKQFKLQQQMEDAMTKVQPMMLLYAIDHIERMVDRSSPDVTGAIALTSELLSDVMMYHGEEQHLFSREIELVKKLVCLVALFREDKPEVEFFISGDPGHIQLPPMILFSFVDLIFRKFEEAPMIPELNIEASGFSNMITIQVLLNGRKKHEVDLEQCMNSLQQMDSYYQGKVSITHEAHSYGCSVIIRNNDPGSVNTIHTFPDVVDMV